MSKPKVRGSKAKKDTIVAMAIPMMQRPPNEYVCLSVLLTNGKSIVLTSKDGMTTQEAQEFVDAINKRLHEGRR